MTKRIYVLLALAAASVVAIPDRVAAQTAPVLANVVTTCGTPNSTYTAGQNRPATQDTGGKECVNGPGGSSSSPLFVKPTPLTVTTLDIKTVTTGGTAVVAIAASHRSAGGFIQNPVGATIALCINEIGTATGTTSSGDTTCIQPGQSYSVAPASTAVSVISSDSSHPFSGYGLQ